MVSVTQTLQLDVDELFEQLLTWGDGDCEAEQPAAAAPLRAAGSKKICGNVEEDQPDLIGLDVWPAAITLCNYIAAHPELVSGASVMELGAGTHPSPVGHAGLRSAALAIVSC